MLHQKTMGYYTPTRVDFTKTYHSPPKIHGLSIESMDFGWSFHGVLVESSWSPHGVLMESMESMETPRGLHRLHGLQEDSMETRGGLSNTAHDTEITLKF